MTASRYGFAHIGRVGSVFMTLSVTIERFFAIAYPLKKIQLKRGLILFSVLGAIVYNVPRFFELRMVSVTELDPDTNENKTVSSPARPDISFPVLNDQLFYLELPFDSNPKNIYFLEIRTCSQLKKTSFLVSVVNLGIEKEHFF